MINRTIGFVGGGRITGVILDGLTRAGALPAAIIVLWMTAGVVMLNTKEPKTGSTETCR